MHHHHHHHHSSFVSSFTPPTLHPQHTSLSNPILHPFKSNNPTSSKPRFANKIIISCKHDSQTNSQGLKAWMKKWASSMTLSGALIAGSLGLTPNTLTSNNPRKNPTPSSATPVEIVAPVEGVKSLLDNFKLKDMPTLNLPLPHTQQPQQQPSQPQQLPKTEKGLIQNFGQYPPKPRVSTSFVTQAVQSVGSAVVRIDTERVMNDIGFNLSDLFDDPAMKKFFSEKFRGGIQPFPPLQPHGPHHHHHHHHGHGPGGGLGERQIERGQGSGFFISSDGLLVTNAHVVKNVSKCKITLTDGSEYEGIVKGTDDLFDVAVVKINNAKGREFPIAKMGISENMQVGDWVIAVGNPVGLDNTVTLGIVSSLNRSSDEVGYPDKRLNFIQTDAAINLGNSGGPLVNEFGEVVGINTCIRAGAEGIGFAIPVDRVRNILAQLARGEKVRHPFVGIHMATISPDYARRNNKNPNAHTQFPEVDGVLIVRIVPNSPAAHCGLRRYDVIRNINDVPVRCAQDAQRIFDNATVGQIMKMKVVRGGKDMNVSVKTGDVAEKLRKDPSSIQLRPAEPLPKS